jgi:3-oxoacyl-(acyl-carrier-protein) synthase
MGVVAPGAPDVPALLRLLQGGPSPIRHLPEHEALGFQCQIGGIAQAPAEAFGAYYDYLGLDKAGDFLLLAMAAGLEAWQSAGLPLPHPDSPADFDTGILIGSGFGGFDAVAARVVPLTDQKRIPRLGGNAAALNMLSSPSALLSAVLGTANWHSGNSNACCTGTDAAVEGYWRIRSGRAKRMLVGSTEGYSPYIWAQFDAVRAANSKYNDRAQEASRPMSASARGFVPSSGAGVLLLESLDSALERGAPILAEVLGGQANAGGQRQGGSMTFPNPEGVRRCIRETLECAGVEPSDIGLISGHLTATKADPLEVASWREAFTRHFPAINAPKSIFGHALGGAGAVELVACALQLRHRFLHASRHCEDVHPDIASIIPAESIPHASRPAPELHTLIKASFGFGDVNACLVMRAWE